MRVKDLIKELQEFHPDMEVAFMEYVFSLQSSDDVGCDYLLIDGFTECVINGKAVALADRGKCIESI